MRVDLLAAFAYILGPISGEFSLPVIIMLYDGSVLRPSLSHNIALALLIFETHNDYVRFHGKYSTCLHQEIYP